MTGKIAWPGGARSAVLLTFDYDAETLWFARDATNLRRPSIFSQGTYAPKVGVPKVLELFEDMGVKGTFFTPGWTVERHPASLEAILDHGHEVGHHGYLHKWIDPDDPKMEEEEMDKGLEAHERVLGVRPRGYRPPAATSSERTIQLVADRGFLYCSIMMDDVNPYRHVLADGRPGPVDIPFWWTLDDSMVSLYSIPMPRPIFTSRHIFDLWKEEFDAYYEWGALVHLLLHPQIIGRPGRLAMLRRFIAYMQKKRVWFATCEELARLWLDGDPTQAGPPRPKPVARLPARSRSGFAQAGRRRR